MKFYSKLALHFLRNEINVLNEMYKLNAESGNTSNQHDLNSSMSEADKFGKFMLQLLLNNYQDSIHNKLSDLIEELKNDKYPELNRSLSEATNKFEQNMIWLLRRDSQESNDSIHNKLSDLIEKFKSDMSMIREMYDAPPVDDVKKMFFLIKMIKDECTDSSLWDLEYDDSDPSCIFQYRMLTYIIANTATCENTLSNQNLLSIKGEFKSIREHYFALSSKSAKIDFICSCLENISKHASFPNHSSTKASPLPLLPISFFKISKITWLELASNSPLGRLIESIHREVSDSQERYDALDLSEQETLRKSFEKLPEHTIEQKEESMSAVAYRST